MTDQELKVLELQKKELKRLRQERERLEIGAKLQKERLKLNELYKTEEQREKERAERARIEEEKRAAREEQKEAKRLASIGYTQEEEKDPMEIFGEYALAIILIVGFVIVLPALVL